MKFTTILASLILGVSSLPTGDMRVTANEARIAVLDRASELGEKFQAAMGDVLTTEEIEGFKASITRVAEDAAGDLTNKPRLDELAQSWSDNLSTALKNTVAIAHEKSNMKRAAVKCDWWNFVEDTCGLIPQCSINDVVCPP